MVLVHTIRGIVVILGIFLEYTPYSISLNILDNSMITKKVGVGVVHYSYSGVRSTGT
jgi:hypothetical protein